MRIAADVDRCIGAGQCVFAEPKVFDQDYDGMVLLLTDRPAPDTAEGVRQAVEVCPARALTLSDG